MSVEATLEALSGHAPGQQFTIPSPLVSQNPQDIGALLPHIATHLLDLRGGTKQCAVCRWLHTSMRTNTSLVHACIPLLVWAYSLRSTDPKVTSEGLITVLLTLYLTEKRAHESGSGSLATAAVLPAHALGLSESVYNPVLEDEGRTLETQLQALELESPRDEDQAFPDISPISRAILALVTHRVLALYVANINTVPIESLDMFCLLIYK